MPVGKLTMVHNIATPESIKTIVNKKQPHRSILRLPQTITIYPENAKFSTTLCMGKTVTTMTVATNIITRP